jgi:hypothetical protein
MAIKGYWRLNGNSNDASGNGNNGTDTNITYSQANGRLNQGAGLNGSSSVIRCSTINYSSLYSSNFSVSFNLRLNSYPSNNNGVVSWGNGGVTPFYYWSLWITSTGMLVFGNYNGANSSVDSQILSLNKWYHIALSVSTSGNISIYVDSKLYSASIPTTPVKSRTDSYNRTIVGKESNENVTRYINGSIDEITYINFIISLAQVKNEYSRIKGFF